MSKLSYKSLLIIFSFLLIGVIVLAKFVLPKNKVSAAWWNDGWNYRKAITVINNTNFDATNIPYKINLDTASLITAGKLQSDADDIRIVDQNGKIVRSQVEKSTLNTANTKIWFEATVKSNHSSSYYIYYGNSSTVAPVFESNISTLTSTSSSATVTMKDGFSYTISNSNGGRVTDVKKNSSSLGIAGNIMNSSSYPGNWWSSSALTQTVLNSTGPLFVEINYGAGATGSYSAYGTNHKIFNNGFVETQISVTYNTSGSENFYYYLSFANGTRNSVWVNGSGTLVDQSTDSGTLTESSLGQNWFGQRWTSTGIYGGTIITKNGSDWVNGNTSAQASYYQTNYSYTQAFASGYSRDVRFGLFVGNGGLTEMQQKGANYGALSSSLTSEEAGGGPIAYWKFDEGSGSIAHNSISTNHNGTLGGGSTLPIWQNEDQCISGKCLKFDGVDDYISAGTGANYFPLPTFSTCAWIKTPGLGTGMSINGIFSLTYGLSMYLNGSGQFVTYMDDGVNIVGKTVTSVNLHDNKFHHLCLTYDGTNRNMYIDGVQKLSVGSTWLGTTRWPTNGVNIGHENNNSPIYKFNGLIDEVKIYPYARTAAQIKLDYNSRGSSSGSSVNLGVKSSTSPDLSSKLIAYYKFDEGVGTTIYDSSTNKLNGTLQSGTSIPTWSTAGKINKSLYFLGNDNSYVSVSDAGTSSPLDLTNEFTISGWINIKTLTTYDSLIYKYDSYAILPWGDGTVRFFDRDSSWGEKLRSKSIISINKWTYVSVTYSTNNSKLKLYINGKLDNEATISLPLVVNNNPLYIGKGYTGENGNMSGYIDEVKIYNTALTDDEVKQDYNQGSAISFGSTTQNIGGTTTSLDYCIPGDTSYCASPVAEYKMDEGTGAISFDTAGNKNIGITTPLWTQGKTGKGLLFNGSNYGVITDPGINNTNTFTIEYWLKNDPTVALWSDSFSFGNSAFRFENTNANNADFTIYNPGITGTITCSNCLIPNSWNHLALTSNSSNWYLYSNGILKVSGSTTGTLTGSSNIYLGVRFPGSSFWKGSLDHLKIYNYARTPAQVAYDYNKGGPVGWWKFDECQGNTAYDWSGIGNTGTISIGSGGSQNSLGTCTTFSTGWGNGATGKINSSLNFDGTDDYIGNLKNVLTANTNSETISAWVKLNNLSGDKYIFIQNGPTLFHVNNDKLVGGIYTGSWTNITSISSLVANVWSHVVMTYDGSNIKLYVNGKFDNSVAKTGNLASLSCVEIGRFNGGDCSNGISNYFNGQLDDVRLYNYALTSEQIKTLYNGGAVNFN